MTRELTLARRAGAVAGLLGVAAGTLQLAAGTTPWTGNKNDPVTLGIVTLILAGGLVLASMTTTRATTTDRRLAIASAFLIAALLGLTTAGPAWVPAAVAALAAGGLAGQSAARTGSVRGAIARKWPATLLVTLAAVYLSLGLTAMGTAGLLGIAGSVAVLGALAVRTRARNLAVALLIAGAIPFAVMTHSSLVTPLAGILMLAIGLPLLRTAPTVLPPSLPVGSRVTATPNAA
jgi:hypothetical protein